MTLTGSWITRKPDRCGSATPIGSVPGTGPQHSVRLLAARA